MVVRRPRLDSLDRCSDSAFPRDLRATKAQGEPFHVLHFDGHGAKGAIFFENPDTGKNAEPVAAADLAKLLNETGVPVLILNACRSAFAEPPQQPRPWTRRRPPRRRVGGARI